MEEDGVLDDGQAEAGAPRGAASACVDAVEALEESGQVLLRDARAVIRVGEMPEGAVAAGAERDRGALAGVGQRVVQEVAEDAVDQGLVAVQVDHPGGLEAERHPARCEGRGHLVAQQVQGFGHVDGVEGIEGRGVGVVHPVEYGEVAQQGAQALGLREAALQKEAALLLGEVGVLEDRLQVALDAGDGGLELVGDVLGELAAHQRVLGLGGAGDDPVHLAGVPQQDGDQEDGQRDHEPQEDDVVVERGGELDVEVEVPHECEHQRQEDGEDAQEELGAERDGSHSSAK